MLAITCTLLQAINAPDARVVRSLPLKGGGSGWGSLWTSKTHANVPAAHRRRVSVPGHGAACIGETHRATLRHVRDFAVDFT